MSAPRLLRADYRGSTDGARCIHHSRWDKADAAQSPKCRRLPTLDSCAERANN